MTRGAAGPLLRALWQRVPEPVTSSAPARAARRAAIRALTGHPPVEPRVVRTPAELDDVIASLEAAVRVSDDELRRGFGTFRLELDRSMPDDPFSPAYRDAVLETYEWLHGAPYTPANEATPFDMDAALHRPFPFHTGSPVTTGDYLMAVGHLIRTARLGPGDRVLEMGPGWGNVAVPLAQLGCHVTAVDVCAAFTDLVRARAAQVGAEVDARTGDFAAIEDVVGAGARFDAVVFFESLHHCVDHVALLRTLGRMTDKVVLAAEPVAARFHQPWGLRLDGESVWAIRRNGWLELGFRTSYLSEALERTGWRSELFRAPAGAWGEIRVATRI